MSVSGQGRLTGHTTRLDHPAASACDYPAASACLYEVVHNRAGRRAAAMIPTANTSYENKSSTEMPTP